MSFGAVITTFTGAFIFPFLIRLCWGKMCDSWGPIGGWMAAGFIVGTAWTLNHGVGFMVQSGPAWIDMAWAAGVGLFVASAASGDDVGKGLVNALFAIIGGVLGGFILSCLG
ncbi:Lin0368 family putative glycerol transporter subunit [Wukongibacter sp. M2B1]|uniref:Lin0368 family putative glycerol transporter subunit n=1 Tax=Wukongibacter sp. M2B1 TaxID=3088895 RepID=UPI003D7B748A